MYKPALWSLIVLAISTLYFATIVSAFYAELCAIAFLIVAGYVGIYAISAVYEDPWTIYPVFDPFTDDTTKYGNITSYPEERRAKLRELLDDYHHIYVKAEVMGKDPFWF